MNKEKLKKEVVVTGLILSLIPIIMLFHQLLLMYINGWTIGEFAAVSFYNRFGEAHFEFWFFMAAIPVMFYSILHQLKLVLGKKRRSRHQ